LKGRCSSQTRIGRGLGWVRRTSKQKNNNKKAKRNMKTLIKTVLYLQMSALCVTATFAGSGSGQHPLPLKGTIQAVETYDVQFPTLFVDTSGSGNATHLGRFTVTSEFEVDLPTFIATGSAQFIAANGDSIFTVTEARGEPQSPEPDVLFIVEMYTITGGTGRFAGATGSFTVERLLNSVTGVTSGSFEGTIVLIKGK
jgi:hypothetical protein